MGNIFKYYRYIYIYILKQYNNNNSTKNISGFLTSTATYE